MISTQVLGVVDTTDDRPHQQFIEDLRIRKIKGFIGTIDENGEYFDSVYKMNRSLAASISSDYRDRFLIELIQNAYDAHPLSTQEGKIKLTLDRRWGKFGVLFVANEGSPFTEDDVKSLCSIGLSEKPLGQSIGNKGLGFRSVIQIMDVPLVFSQNSNSPGDDYFSGYCFRFAVSRDYMNIIRGRQTP